LGLNHSNLKNYKFRLNTFTYNDNIYVKRATYKNTLYIYVYEKHLFHDKLVVALKVSVHE
jgi:hypothetical protein